MASSKSLARARPKYSIRWARNSTGSPRHLIPVELRIRPNELGNIGDPNQLLPKILRSVNAQDHQRVLGRKCANRMPAHVDLHGAPKKIIEVGLRGKMPQGELGVKLEHRAPLGAGVVVLPGNQAGLHAARVNPRESRLVTQSLDRVMRAFQIALAQNDIQVLEFAQSDIGVSLRGDDGTFVRNRGNAARIERVHDANQFSGKREAADGIRPGFTFQAFRRRRWNQIGRNVPQLAVKKRENRMFVSLGENEIPVERLAQGGGGSSARREEPRSVRAQQTSNCFSGDTPPLEEGGIRRATFASR